MTENKLYQQCLEEAQKIIESKNSVLNRSLSEGFERIYELNQLAAELYAMKMADWTSPIGSTDFYITSNTQWHYVTQDDIVPIGTTQDLHNLFVKEGNETV